MHTLCMAARLAFVPNPGWILRQVSKPGGMTGSDVVAWRREAISGKGVCLLGCEPLLSSAVTCSGTPRPSLKQLGAWGIHKMRRPFHSTAVQNNMILCIC